MRIFTAGLRKLIGRPASFVSVGLLVGLLGLILIAAATVQENGAQGAARARALITFPGAYDLILSFMFGLGGLVAVIYGAANLPGAPSLPTGSRSLTSLGQAGSRRSTAPSSFWWGAVSGPWRSSSFTSRP